MSTTAALAALRANPIECPHCGRSFAANNAATHIPACSPEARERRRVRYMLHAREVRSRPGWVRPATKRDACPDCGSSKNATSARCKDCDKGGPRTTAPEQRFWRYVDTTGGLAACWPWTGARNPLGYGAFNLGDGSNRAIGAHRFSLELVVGPLPKGHGALHKCDNPPCVNPAHLYAGTQKDNMRDARERGRLRPGGRSVA